MAEIYYPINRFFVHRVIPIEDDIIYSTDMNATFYKGRKKREFKTHVLMTPNGFALYDRRDFSISLHKCINFINWSQIEKVSGSKIYITKKYYLKLYRSYRGVKKIFETKNTFKKRKKAFEQFIAPYIAKCKQEKRGNFTYDNILELEKKSVNIKAQTHCPRCKRENRDLNYFCQYCGKNLVMIN